MKIKTKEELSGFKLKTQFTQNDFQDPDDFRVMQKCRALVIEWIRRLCTEGKSNYEQARSIHGVNRLQQAICVVDCNGYMVVREINNLMNDRVLNEQWEIFNLLIVGEYTMKKLQGYSTTVQSDWQRDDGKICVDDFEDFAEQIVDSIWSPREWVAVTYETYCAIEDGKGDNAMDVTTLKLDYTRATFMLDFDGHRYEPRKGDRRRLKEIRTAHSIAVDIKRNDSITLMDPNIGEIEIDGTKKELTAVLAQWLALMGCHFRLFSSCTACYFGKANTQESQLDTVRKNRRWISERLP